MDEEANNLDWTFKASLIFEGKGRPEARLKVGNLNFHNKLERLSPVKLSGPV